MRKKPLPPPGKKRWLKNPLSGKIKEELTLKFKDISNEIIKAQHESFSAEQKTALSALLSPFAEQLKAFKTEVASAREESIKASPALIPS